MSDTLDELLKKLPSDAVVSAGYFKGRKSYIEVMVKPEYIREVMKRVKGLGYTHFVGIETVDWYGTDDTFELIYYVSSVQRGGDMVIVRTKIPRQNPEIDSIHDIFPFAYYQEIENYEFFGIRFRGHDGLRLWILEGNWEGPPPLRKDFDSRQWVLEHYYGGKRYSRPVKG